MRTRTYQTAWLAVSLMCVMLTGVSAAPRNGTWTDPADKTLPVDFKIQGEYKAADIGDILGIDEIDQLQRDKARLEQSLEQYDSPNLAAHRLLSYSRFIVFEESEKAQLQRRSRFRQWRESLRVTKRS